MRAICSEQWCGDTGFEEEMVGFNEQGQCKIWLNANFFKNIEEE
jgi:hypothetical protein